MKKFYDRSFTTNNTIGIFVIYISVEKMNFFFYWIDAFNVPLTRGLWIILRTHTSGITDAIFQIFAFNVYNTVEGFIVSYCQVAISNAETLKDSKSKLSLSSYWFRKISFSFSIKFSIFCFFSSFVLKIKIRASKWQEVEEMKNQN